MTIPYNGRSCPTHCCAKHGCKYGYPEDTCVVTNGNVKQVYPCEDCHNEPSDLEKLRSTFDEIGITYKLEETRPGCVNLWICGARDSLNKAKAYGRLFEFIDGGVASF